MRTKLKSKYLQSLFVVFIALSIIALISCANNEKKTEVSDNASNTLEALKVAPNGDSDKAFASESEQATKDTEKNATGTTSTTTENSNSNNSNNETTNDSFEKMTPEQKKEVYKKLSKTEVPQPVFSIKSGISVNVQTVVLTCALKEALIIYTVDGSKPTSKNGKEYLSAIEVKESTIIRSFAYIPGGLESKVVEAEYTIGELFVSLLANGNGSKSQPLGSVKAALIKAKEIGITKIKLAQGVYNESFVIDFNVEIKGSYTSDFKSQSKTMSEIKAENAEKTAQNAPGYAIKIQGSSVDKKTKLENLKITGGDAQYAAGVFVTENASPYISNCVITGGFGSYSYGLRSLSNAKPEIVSSRINGGEGSTCFGVSADSAEITISRSYVDAGSGKVAGYALAGTNARVRSASNVLVGNQANVSYGVALYSCQEARIEHCTISGGSGKDAYGVFVSVCNPVILNNIIQAKGKTKSFGIYENYGESSPTVVSGNVFLNCASGIYLDTDTKLAFTQCAPNGNFTTQDGNLLLTPSATLNALANFELDSEKNYQSPAQAKELLKRVKLLAGASAFDIKGNKRSDTATIGAYEL